ncbi:hypothetical protein GCM10010497_58660 [Streptomyces cinereoruber]|uniref:Uncharacterized protein n=1 Tax=Streptomyces cinereoruber TaxID=67260 RepID=A0AAV4KRG5_9ACTN|nr:hypothetical protein GCM10010497_58660 [Streptomyces cinereoruber]
MMLTYRPIFEAADGGAGEAVEIVDARGACEVAGGTENDVILSHPKVSGLRSPVLQLRLPCAWAHVVRSGTPEVWRSDVRIRVICPMPAGS